MDLIQILGAFELGLIYTLVTLGVYLTFKVLDFPDLTVDGSFPLGALLCAFLITKGYNPWLATLYACAGGLVAGFMTAFLHVRFRIMGLLASILVMTGLYSVNLRITNFQPNIALLDEPTIFSSLPALMPSNWNNILLLSLIVLIALAKLIWFLKSDMGLALRATGSNPHMAQAQGIRISSMRLLGIAISNSFVALGGALFAQSQGFADINMGLGTIVLGLASIILGLVLVRSNKIVPQLLGCLMGALVYRLIVAFALEADVLGLAPSDLNLLTAGLLGLTLILSKARGARQPQEAL